MKHITAIIQPHMLPRVMESLHAIPHFPGATVSDCQGQGRGRGKGGHFEATQETIFYAKKVKLEIFCTDESCEALIAAIETSGHTGRAGDGILVVSDIARAVRLRTAEEQEQAL